VASLGALAALTKKCPEVLSTSPNILLAFVHQAGKGKAQTCAEQYGTMSESATKSKKLHYSQLAEAIRKYGYWKIY